MMKMMKMLGPLFDEGPAPSHSASAASASIVSAGDDAPEDVDDAAAGDVPGDNGIPLAFALATDIIMRIADEFRLLDMTL
jgi:hypothetical protein